MLDQRDQAEADSRQAKALKEEAERQLAEVERARDQLRAMLKDDGPVPAAPFDGLEVLLPARGYKNRHASILLPLEAAADAIAEAEKAQT